MSNKAIEINDSRKRDIVRIADRCVKCGLCSTHCPTYLLRGNENESPRGRIALAQALTSDHLLDTTKVSEHFNSCLSCRRCEKLCPSGVEFGQLHDLVMTEICERDTSGISLNRVERKIIKFIASRKLDNWNRYVSLWRLFFRPIRNLLKISSKTKRLQHYIPDNFSPHSRKPTQITSSDNNTVFLFIGCLSNLFDSQTLTDSIKLLERCGYKVIIPEEQGCCGALPKHCGLEKSAKDCEINNHIAFNNKGKDAPILYFASGCGAALKEYRNTFENNEVGIAHRFIDVATFLLNSEAFHSLEFAPLRSRVVAHSPCSEKNVLKISGVTKKLLEHIPQIQIYELEESTGCCGASGKHMISDPEDAALFRQPILDNVHGKNAELLVTTNYTCGMHLNAGLKEKALDIKVMHPISLLWQQLKNRKEI